MTDKEGFQEKLNCGLNKHGETQEPGSKNVITKKAPELLALPLPCGPASSRTFPNTPHPQHLPSRAQLKLKLPIEMLLFSISAFQSTDELKPGFNMTRIYRQRLLMFS